MWDQGSGSRGVRDEMGANSLKKWVVDLQHGTEVEGSYILAQRATIPSKVFCGLKAHILKLYIVQ
jgi:hypothetical protein